MKELKILPLLHLMLVYVVVALMSYYPANHLYSCHWLSVNHIKQAFFCEFAYNTALAANNVLRPFSIFEEFFYSNHSTFLVFNVWLARVTELEELSSHYEYDATVFGPAANQSLSHLQFRSLKEVHY